MTTKRIRYSLILFALLCMFPLVLAAQPANLMVNPSSLDFGEVTPGAYITETVYVSLLDPGDPTPIAINEVLVYGTGYSYNMDNPTPVWISPGMTVEIQVNFNPTDPGDYPGNLIVYDNFGNVYPVTLYGLASSGSSGPIFSIDPVYVSYELEEMQVAQVSGTIYNTGTEVLTVDLNSETVLSWMRITDLPYGATNFDTINIEPGGSADIFMLIDASDLAPDHYTGEVELITNEGGTSTQYWMYSIQVLYKPIRAFFNVTQTSCVVGEQIQFIDQSRTDPNETGLSISSWHWDFDGDGMEDSTDQAPYFTYSEAGVYPVGLRVVSNLGHEDTLIKEDYITVAAPPALICNPDSLDFGSVIAGGTATQIMTVHLSAESSFGSNGISLIDVDNPVFIVEDAAFAYPVQLGGPTWCDFNVRFAPESIGYYDGFLQIRDLFGTDTLIPLHGVATGPVTWISIEPSIYQHSQPELSYSEVYLKLKNNHTEEVTYELIESTVPDWIQTEWGVIGRDGSLAPGDSTNVLLGLKSYNLAPGSTYTADLSYYCSDGDAYTVSMCRIELYVSYLPVRADFEADPLVGTPGTLIQFTDLSRIDPAQVGTDHIVEWSWDFDQDGTVDSNEQNPVYSYPAMGQYSVSLSVLTLLGHSHEWSMDDYITIQNMPPEIVSIPTMVTTDEDTDYEFLATSFFADPEGEDIYLTFLPSQHLHGEDRGDGSYAIVPVLNWFGTETITIHAWDPWDGSVSAELNVQVLPVNDAPEPSVPEDIYKIRNSTLVVDFADYVEDPDNPDEELSISIQTLWPQPNIQYNYSPDTPGNMICTWVSTPDWWGTGRYRITYNDNEGRAVATADFNFEVLENFTVVFGYEGGPYTLAGQPIPFLDLTLGNPDWWEWDFDNDGLIDSYEQNPVYIYPHGGTYTVRLTLGNTEAGLQGTAMIQDYLVLQGTAVMPGQPAPPQMTIDGSPYNVPNDFVFPDSGTIVIEPGVVINFLSPDPVPLDGNILGDGALFQGEDGQPWGGFVIGDGATVNLNGCTITDATYPLQIINSSPTLQNLSISYSNPNRTITGTAISLNNSSALLENIEIADYQTGISIGGAGTRTTPTLTNIRVRNSSEAQRREGEGTGIKITGETGAILDDVIIEDMYTGIEMENETLGASTPTLTNIRVRNSSEASRSLTNGIVISGNVYPELNDVIIEEASLGLYISGSTDPTRDTPTLTNVRVRNSNETQRTETTGFLFEDVPSLIMEQIEVENATMGIHFVASESRTLSTPTLTNIRVRNSSEASRELTTGISFEGAVLANLNDAVIESCHTALYYNGIIDETRTTATPTLTNIRVRNSSEASRGESFGLVLRNLSRVIVDQDSIGGCTTAISVTNDERTLSTPTLTNIRVRNSSEGQRFPNVGVLLGSGVRGKLSACDIGGAKTGLEIEEGNQTILEANSFRNCGTAIRAWAMNPGATISQQTISLDPTFMMEHPEWDFQAFELLNSPQINLAMNTIVNYPRLITFYNSIIRFTSNIAWGNEAISNPFSGAGGGVNADHSDIRFPVGPYPGMGNINMPPLFANPELGDYSLISQSPCIDAGAPDLRPDDDGSIPDMGAYCYLHRADFSPNYRFIQTGTTVDFSNLSIGHNVPQLSQAMWDLGNDDTIDAISYDWQYTFDTPGVYDLKLIMQTGILQDEVLYERLIVVQNLLLQAPVIESVSYSNGNIVLDWEPVESTVDGEPASVDYYLVYSSLNPDGNFLYRAYTQAPQTQYQDIVSLAENARFYIVLGYAGTREELEEFISRHPMIVPSIRPRP